MDKTSAIASAMKKAKASKEQRNKGYSLMGPLNDHFDSNSTVPGGRYDGSMSGTSTPPGAQTQVPGSGSYAYGTENTN